MKQLTILFFASLREQLQCTELSLDFVQDETVAELVARLISEKGKAFEALKENSIKAAVNSGVCDRDYALSAGDEIAFFPPVTGG